MLAAEKSGTWVVDREFVVKMGYDTFHVKNPAGKRSTRRKVENVPGVPDFDHNSIFRITYAR